LINDTAAEGAKLTDRQAEIEKKVNQRTNENASENAYKDQDNAKKDASKSFVFLDEEPEANSPADIVGSNMAAVEPVTGWANAAPTEANML
jgi:hypothetical protein